MERKEYPEGGPFPPWRFIVHANKVEMTRIFLSILLIVLITPFSVGQSVLTENGQYFQKGMKENLSLLDNTLGLDVNKTKTNSWTIVADNESMQRGLPCLAYDSRNDVMVMFGGLNGYRLNDTWILDMSTRIWSKREPLYSPDPRWDSSMVYDSMHGVMIMFGGDDNYNYSMGGTWEYNVTTNRWLPRAEHTGPIARLSSAMAYDPVNDATILFGGFQYNQPMNDTWVYHYTTDIWTNISTPNAPPVRGGHGMAYDIKNDVIVMFGGYSGGLSDQQMGDTWIYDVKTNIWTNKTSSAGPSGRSPVQLAYDSVNDKIVLFGGCDEVSRRNDTWTYDVQQNKWTIIDTPNSPSARYCHKMAADTNNGIMVLFGGQTNTSNRGDTWFYGIKRYDDTGTYESIPFDLTGNAYFGAIEWTAATSRNTTVFFQIRTANDSANLSNSVYIGPDGTPGTYYDTNGAYLSSVQNGSRWLQYKAYFTTINDEETPFLKNITIRYNLIQSVQILEPSGQVNWTGNHLIKWSAKDPDNDSLLFDILLRTGNQSIYLVHDLPNNNRNWLWNTNPFENGTYQIIIKAKDENPTIPLNVDVSSEELIIFHPANPSISNAELTLEGFPWLLVIIILLALAADVGLYFREKRKVKYQNRKIK